jgi:hypothetical protein
MKMSFGILEEEFEDTKGEIRKKDRKYNGQNKKNYKTLNRKLKIDQHKPHL